MEENKTTTDEAEETLKTNSFSKGNINQFPQRFISEVVKVLHVFYSLF